METDWCLVSRFLTDGGTPYSNAYCQACFDLQGNGDLHATLLRVLSVRDQFVALLQEEMHESFVNQYHWEPHGIDLGQSDKILSNKTWTYLQSTAIWLGILIAILGQTEPLPETDSVNGSGQAQIKASYRGPPFKDLTSALQSSSIDCLPD